MIVQAGDLLFCITRHEIAGWTKLSENTYYKIADGSESYKKPPVFSFNSRDAPKTLKEGLLAAGMPEAINGHWFAQDSFL